MNTLGSFFWLELLTSDVAGATKFYSKVVGWAIEPHAFVPGYQLFSSANSQVGGMMGLDAGIIRPVWLGYICVEDVDATVNSMVQDGATLCVPATSIPGVGRFAMLRDPQGVGVYVMRSAAQGGASRSFAAEVGHCQWSELLTTDMDAALKFYTRHVGWEKGDVMPMGPIGDYQFLLNRGERFGAMMKRGREGAPPIWRYYFGVADIDRAIAATVEAGGQVISPPQQVPGGGFAAVAVDPQGAEFGLAGPRITDTQ